MVAGDWGELRKVVAIGKEISPESGGRLILLAVAIWTTHMVVFAAEQLPEFEPPNPGTWVGWQITDDAGTRYVLAGGSRSGHDQIMALSDQAVSPAPPPEATRLVLGPRMKADEAVQVSIA